jgi:hypothetical protein
MKKTILTIAAILVASSTAFAGDRYGDAAPALNAPNVRIVTSASKIAAAPQEARHAEDAAKASVVVNVPTANFGSTAAIGGRANSIGASPRILYGSN